MNIKPYCTKNSTSSIQSKWLYSFFNADCNHKMALLIFNSVVMCYNVSKSLNDLHLFFFSLSPIPFLMSEVMPALRVKIIDSKTSIHQNRVVKYFEFFFPFSAVKYFLSILYRASILYRLPCSWSMRMKERTNEWTTEWIPLWYETMDRLTCNFYCEKCKKLVVFGLAREVLLCQLNEHVINQHSTGKIHDIWISNKISNISTYFALESQSTAMECLIFCLCFCYHITSTVVLRGKHEIIRSTDYSYIHVHIDYIGIIEPCVKSFQSSFDHINVYSGFVSLNYGN